MTDVLVLGAGPAGCAVALGLRRIGVSVEVLSRTRTDTIEGITPRSVELMRTLGLAEAVLECITATPRTGYWAGKRIAVGRESIVSRLRFDAALGRDLANAGLVIVPTIVREIRPGPRGFRVVTDAGERHARCLIDARGRRARRADELGPRLIAFGELHRARTPVPRGSVVIALEHGWSWIASMGEHADDRLLLQYIGSPYNPARPSTRALLAAASEHAPQLASALTEDVPLAASSGRAAVARFSLPAQVPGLLRVGDAAVASDPLSGHGIFEALRSAQAAIAAINSYLSGMNWTPIARFVNERASEVWRRTLTAAAEFYRREAEHNPTAFWKFTADAYAALATHAGPKHSGPARVESRPVLNGSRIELRDLWVSAQWPRGIWKVNGREYRPTFNEEVGR